MAARVLRNHILLELGRGVVAGVGLVQLRQILAISDVAALAQGSNPGVGLARGIRVRWNRFELAIVGVGNQFVLLIW